MIVFGFGSGTVTLEGAPAELKWFSSGGRFTVTDGAAPFGSTLHGLTNIEPGMRTFRAEVNGKPCMWDPMIWPGDEPGTVTVPIRAGWWTRLMEVRCNGAERSERRSRAKSTFTPTTTTRSKKTSDSVVTNLRGAVLSRSGRP